MEDNNSNFNSGAGFNSLLLIAGMILCILEGSHVLNIGWLYACIPFIIFASELGLGLIIVIIVAIVKTIQDSRL